MMIRGEELGFSFGDKRVFAGISVEVHPGAITALVGPSGSGKTVLLHTLGGMIAPDQGAVYVDGEEASAWPDSRRLRFWRESAAFIQQDYGVVEEESVAFNITMRSSLWGRTIIPDRPKLEEALERVGLTGRAAETAARLSGGEKQRVAIARALYKGARVWFADEPTASLDADNQMLVRTLFREAAESGAAIIVATHDLDFARSCEQRVQLASRR
ncbi:MULTISPECIES: ABC transporter ATP-binding protein [unclassified Corynebacterium]|uniref:ABC transporter ATP-binding protein n=1 Tax=unclassified Corynebacterium TaxID=2624378 RepID=UPI0029CA33F0|nr:MULTISPECIES: ATP-binding cassette domain-containing protein [unclassified Corynebacterium]WPF66932.1 ATP-binding cassette domain-containing protein [Corynebacterium sp. 22KM0430]WPF69420.1 ATP-binding cassette domain-containing protein [Corynebacterium sp. 21KM1197]